MARLSLVSAGPRGLRRHALLDTKPSRAMSCTACGSAAETVNAQSPRFDFTCYCVADIGLICDLMFAPVAHDQVRLAHPPDPRVIDGTASRFNEFSHILLL